MLDGHHPLVRHLRWGEAVFQVLVKVKDFCLVNSNLIVLAYGCLWRNTVLDGRHFWAMRHVLWTFWMWISLIWRRSVADKPLVPRQRDSMMQPFRTPDKSRHKGHAKCYIMGATAKPDLNSPTPRQGWNWPSIEVDHGKLTRFRGKNWENMWRPMACTGALYVMTSASTDSLSNSSRRSKAPSQSAAFSQAFRAELYVILSQRVFSINLDSVSVIAIQIGMNLERIWEKLCLTRVKSGRTFLCATSPSNWRAGRLSEAIEQALIAWYAWNQQVKQKERTDNNH